MKNNEVDSFLGDLNQTTDDSVFDNKEDVLEGFDEPQLEDIVEEVKVEKPIPYHKNPEFKKLKEANKELSQRVERLSELEKFVRSSASDDDELTSVLTQIIGNDTPEKELGVRNLRKVLLGIKDEARNEALESFQAREEQAKQAEREASQMLNESLESLEETYSIDLTSNAPLARKTRTEFLTFVQRIAPKNGNGEITQYPDFHEAFDVFQETRRNSATTQQNTRAKDIAARSMSRSTESQIGKPIERTTWDSVSRAFDKLTG